VDHLGAGVGLPLQRATSPTALPRRQQPPAPDGGSSPE
jgi:hypothetical protein